MFWTGLPTLRGHLDSVLGAQSHERLQDDALAGHELQTPSLRNCGQHQHGLHPGELLADALPRAPAKGEVGKLRQRCFEFRRPAIGIEAFWIGEEPGVAVRHERAQNDAARGTSNSPRACASIARRPTIAGR